jgi:hypothetical protein|tara:strand:- start:64 stop:324 length:261 start_codon:yes stop_codon:yes gene_type:complete
MRWSYDDVFEYPLNTLSKLEVSWNLDELEEIVVTMVEWDDDTGHRHYTGDELWEMDSDLAEEIESYIDDEFLHSEDFWLTKMGYDF